ncbi:MAG: hypothetical protein ACKOX6_06745 [Bdellovibrio sp.]
MRIVRFISGNECNSSLLTEKSLKLFDAVLNNSASAAELARLCCKAGICPLLFKAPEKPIKL